MNARSDTGANPSDPGLREAFAAQKVIYGAIQGGPKTTALEVMGLLYFAMHPDAVQTEAAEALGVNQPAISAWLIKWQELGFLELEPDPNRLNKKNIRWTVEGRRLFTLIRTVMQR